MHILKNHISAQLPEPEASSSDDQRNANAQGLSLEVYRLQERVRKLPLVPREDWLRKKRNELVERLFIVARRDRCLSRINPWAARDSVIPSVTKR